MVRRNRRKRGFAETLFSLGLDFEKLEGGYFSPILNIAHHVSVSITRDTWRGCTNVSPSWLWKDPSCQTHFRASMSALNVVATQPRFWTPTMSVVDSLFSLRTRLDKAVALKERPALALASVQRPRISRERHFQRRVQARHMAESVQQQMLGLGANLESRSSLALRGARGSLGESKHDR